MAINLTIPGVPGADTLGKRITQRLDKLGMKAAPASIASGNGEDFVRNILRKEAAGQAHIPRADKLGALAAVLHTTPAWLLRGEGPEEVDYDDVSHFEPGPTLSATSPAPQTVRLIGYVVAGAEAKAIPLPDEELDTVPAPPGANADTRALEVRGQSLGELFDRWIVFFDEVRRPITADLIGKLCVLGLEDGRIVVKKVARDKSGAGYVLLSNTEPPMKDVVIEWAAKVKSMEPR